MWSVFACFRNFDINFVFGNIQQSGGFLFSKVIEVVRNK